MEITFGFKKRFLWVAGILEGCKKIYFSILLQWNHFSINIYSILWIKISNIETTSRIVAWNIKNFYPQNHDEGLLRNAGRNASFQAHSLHYKGFAGTRWDRRKFRNLLSAPTKRKQGTLTQKDFMRLLGHWKERKGDRERC